jgi:hypothetical protein
VPQTRLNVLADNVRITGVRRRLQVLLALSHDTAHASSMKTLVRSGRWQPPSRSNETHRCTSAWLT